MPITKEILLCFLKERGNALSGEYLANKFHISRTAIWMHIGRMREMGFVFEAVPRLGYRLLSVPDKMIPELITDGLQTNLLGHKIVLKDHLESTSTTAMQLAAEGYEEGTIVISDDQAKGRGRMGRYWHSLSGKSLTFSLILRPQISPSYLPLITIMGALGIAKYLHKNHYDIAIKWPNDVLIQGKKVAGLLTEVHTEQDSIDFAVLGVGINVNLMECDFPDELIGKAISLKMVRGETLDRLQVLKDVLYALEHYYLLLKKMDTSLILEEWASYSALTGRWVEVIMGSGKKTLAGIVIGTNPYGAMLLRMPSGDVETIMCGDVHVIGA